MRLLKYQILLPITLFVLLPIISGAEITEYRPQVDISVGSFNYLFNKSDLRDLPGFRKPDMGIYLGGYISMVSPLMKLFSDSSKYVSIYEFGIATNPVENSSSILVTMPVSGVVGYPLRVTKKIKFIPFLGGGFSIVHYNFNEVFSPIHFYLITGFEIRRKMLKKSYLRIKCDGGIIYSGRVNSSTFYFIRTRFPIPFLP